MLVLHFIVLSLPIFNWVHAATISIGVLNVRSSPSDTEFWNKTANYLSQKIPEHHFVIKSMGLDCLNNAIDKKQLHFIITNPSHLVQLVSDGAKTLATLQTHYLDSTHQFFAATVITKQGNHLQKGLSSLKSQSLVATSPFEFGGYQIMLREFMLSGISPKKDFFELRFTNGSQENIVHAVLEDEADAGIIRSGLLEEMIESGLIQDNQIAIIGAKETPGFPLLHSSSLYAEWGIANLSNTEVALSRQVAIALLQMPKSNSSTQYKAHYGWHTPADLTTVKGLLRALQLPPYAPKDKIYFAQILKEYGLEISLLTALILVLSISIARVSHINRKLAHSKLELAKHRNNLGHEVIQQTQELSRINKVLENDIKAREKIEATLRRNAQALQGFYEISVNYNNSYADKVELLLALARSHFKMDTVILYKICLTENIQKTVLELESYQGDTRYQDKIQRCAESISLTGELKQIQTCEATQCSKRLQSITIQVNGQPNRMLILVEDIMAESHLSDVDQELLRLMTQWIAAGIERCSIEEERENYRAQVGKIARLFTAGELATGLAHEINQPLTAAGNYISGSLIRLKEEGTSNIEVGLTRAQESLNLASDIIKRLREFVQTGVPRQEEFNLVLAIQRVLDILSTEASRKKVNITLSLPNTLVIVLGDKVQIEQVILNLVRNAVEACSTSGHVKIALKPQDQWVEVSVKDNGHGIPEQDIEAVFDAFHSSKSEGMGLGLAICRSIIEAHHSLLEIQNNQPDPGCQFMFKLRLASGSAPSIEDKR